MGRAPTGGAPAFRFTTREVSEMEKALDANKGSTPARSVVQSLSENFSASADRAGQKPIQWKQVWNWFQNRRHSQKAKIARSPDKQKAVTVVAPEPPHPKRAAAAYAAVPSGTGRRGNDTQQMEFEAKSARDGAWYDVSTFISHRLAPSGDPEVRVRFAGFGSEEDEWVNVRTAVRQRSLPCEASECVAVLPGDLILCFQEGNEQALYYDADILDVQRRRHDVRGCRCRFWVRYRHDQSEEVVPLRKVCRRPETEYRLLKLQAYGKSPVTIEANLALSKPEPSPNASVGEVPASGAVVINSSDVLAHAATTATPSSTVSLPGPVTSSAMLVNAAPVLVSAKIAKSSLLRNSEQTPTVTPQSVEEMNWARPDSSDGVGLTLPGGTSGPIKQPLEEETPSLHMQPEMFDSQSENIVVLDRVDLEGMSRS